jgi:IS30 family transposase
VSCLVTVGRFAAGQPPFEGGLAAGCEGQLLGGQPAEQDDGGADVLVDDGGRRQYRAWRAHQRARQQARRPKAPKLASPRLAAQVTGWLAEWWSPVQISRRLRIEFPGDPMMWVSHETIYQALYVQGRGELRRELARCLRSGRGEAPPAWPRREHRAHQGHGDDQRAPGRG